MPTETILDIIPSDLWDVTLSYLPPYAEKYLDAIEDKRADNSFDVQGLIAKGLILDMDLYTKVHSAKGIPLPNNDTIVRDMIKWNSRKWRSVLAGVPNAASMMTTYARLAGMYGDIRTIKDLLIEAHVRIELEDRRTPEEKRIAGMQQAFLGLQGCMADGIVPEGRNDDCAIMAMSLAMSLGGRLAPDMRGVPEVRDVLWMLMERVIGPVPRIDILKSLLLPVIPFATPFSADPELMGIPWLNDMQSTAVAILSGEGPSEHILEMAKIIGLDRYMMDDDDMKEVISNKNHILMSFLLRSEVNRPLAATLVSGTVRGGHVHDWIVPVLRDLDPHSLREIARHLRSSHGDRNSIRSLLHALDNNGCTALAAAIRGV